nr:glycosyltransferase family 4 protein [Halomonas sp. UBA3074]
MKIIHIISSAASGGAEIYVKDLSKTMVKKGNEVFIVFLDRAKETGRDQTFEAVFLAELESHHIRYGFLGQACRKNPLKGVSVFSQYCREFKPDVIHSHLYYGSVFSFFQFTVPQIYTHHNIKLRTNPFFYKLINVRTSAYIGICLACEKLLKGITSKKVVNIDNGVDIKRLIPKVEYLPKETLQLVSIGTLSVQKNHQLLFNAVSRLKYLDFFLTVAGEGSQTVKLKAMVDELDIAHKVKFIGNSHNVKQLLHDSDLFVMSSAWEGLPIVQIEATLTGLPVLVTDVGGCSEIVERVGNGLVAQTELDDYTEKLKKLIDDAPLRLNFHKNALKNSQNYSIGHSVDRHLELYNSVVKQLSSHA